MFRDFELFRGVDVPFHFACNADLHRVNIAFDVCLAGDDNRPWRINRAFELAVQADHSSGNSQLPFNLDSRFKKGNDFLVRHGFETLPMFPFQKVKAHRNLR